MGLHYRGVFLRRSDIKHYMGIAVAAAERSSMRHRVGCIIVDRDRYRYVRAFNRYLGDPGGDGLSLHAEAWAALRADDNGIRPRAAFVARHNTGLARPCANCMAALKSVGVERVYYTTKPGEWAMEEIA